MSRKFRLLLPVGISLLMASLPGAATAADADTKGEHVLFVGNSFTNGLPELVRLIADANGAAINTDGATRNGARLDELAGRYKEKIHSRRWDAIIMQGHSIGPIFAIHRTIRGAEKIAEICPEARLYVFATWAYASEERFLQKTDVFKTIWAYASEARLQKSDALKKAQEGTIVFKKAQEGTSDEYKDIYKNMQLLLNVGAANVAKAVNAEVVPVGSVWQAALKKHPRLRLHGGDSYHQNKAGSYLSALVFYKVLLGHLPEKAAEECVDQGWIDQATHDKMVAVIESMPRGTFPADGKDTQTKGIAK